MFTIYLLHLKGILHDSAYIYIYMYNMEMQKKEMQSKLLSNLS